MSLNRFARSYAALLVCAPLLAVACGSDDDNTGSGGTGGTGGAAGGAAGTGGNGGTGNIANSGGSGNTGNTSGNGGTGNTGNTGGDGGTGAMGGSAGTGGATGGTGGAAGGAGGTTGGTGGAAGGAGGTTGGTGGTTAGTGGTTGGTGGSTAGTGGSTAGTGGTTGGTGGSTGGTGGSTAGTGGTTGGTGGTTGGTGGTGGGTTVNLYFSEYIEGSGNFNKALEIYNAGDPIDLGTCSVLLYRNGSLTAGTPIVLTSGTLATGAVWKLCVNAGINGSSTTCDQIDGGIDFNGDDPLELICGGVTQDFFGQSNGMDVGSGWGSPVITVDKTLTRKCSVTTGDKVGSDAFDPAIEWDVFDKDTFTDFGMYTCP
ncbi:MAG: hypothetical protein AB7K71_21960 [Polyangiaceae bacterium]